MTDVITANGLVKKFGRTRALDGLDLRVAQGEVHGFLGPNGAGKSTTIRILLGLLRPSAGTVHLLGGDPWADATQLHGRLAYVPGDVSLWPQLTGGEIIDLIGSLRGGTNKVRRQEMLERFELDPTEKGSAYSRGNRQKVVLVAALASDVELLVLDEPTTGLDPLMEDVFAQCIRDERRRGRTILLSSHILSEVEALCDRVTIIRSGRNVETGTLAEMRQVRDTSVDLVLRDQPPDLSSVPHVGDLQVDGTRIRCLVPTEHLGQLLDLVGPYGIVSLACQPPTLEQLFLRHYSVRPSGPAAAVAR